MTTTIIAASTTTMFKFAAAYDQLVVSAGVDIATTAAPAIETAFGLADVIVEGSAYGSMGFLDSSVSGGDIVTVGQSGILLGVGGYGVDIKGNGSHIANSGFIDGAESAGIFAGSSSIVNQGSIEGYYEAIFDAGADNIDNSGTLSSLSSLQFTIYEASGDDTIFNSGSIHSSKGQAAIFANGGQNAITNSGTIGGGVVGVLLAGGSNTLLNSGTIEGVGGGIVITGTVGGTTIENTGLIEAVTQTADAVHFNENGVSDQLINLGTILGAVQFDSGYGALNNSGVIDGEVYLNATDAVVSNSGRISGQIVFSGDYNSYLGAHGDLEGSVYCSGSHGLYVGGARGTTFSITGAQLANTDTITGGASADDTLDITGAGVITTNALKNVSGFETLSLAANESIAIRETLADTAAGHALTIDTSGVDLVNLASVTSTTDAITIWGAGGDIITAGASRYTFAFASAGASTGPSYDLILGVNFAHDKFDVTTGIDAVTGIDTAVKSGSLSNATFNTDLAADLGSTKLSADHAVLFTASAGQLIGDTFLVVDLNGMAGYQANADLAIRLTGPTGTLSLANFI